MPKLTPNIPYEDLGDYCQLAEYHAAWVLNSSKSGEYLALSDFRPETCSSTVIRRASFADVQALAIELPILPQRTYRIGTEQGIVVLHAVMIDLKYLWVVTLEPPIAHKINNPPAVPERTTKRFTNYDDTDRPAEKSGVRSPLAQAELSTLAQAKPSPRPIIRRQRPDYRRH
jgi:hypothetical protein